MAELRELAADLGGARASSRELADGGGPPAHRAGRARGPRPRRARAHRQDTAARPVQAALTSVAAFTLGGARAAGGVPGRARRRPLRRRWSPAVVVVALAALALLGVVRALLGGAPRLRATARVAVGGAAAMGITLLIGELTGAAVG